MNTLTSHSGSLRPVNKKAVVLLCLHAFMFAVVFCFAFFVRSDFSVGATWAWLSPRTLLGVVAIKSGVFYALGHCHASWRRVSFNDLTRLVWAATLSMLVLTSVRMGLPWPAADERVHAHAARARTRMRKPRTLESEREK